MIREARQQMATAHLTTVPFLGPVRTTVLIGVVETPHRFRTKRQFWSYIGLA